MENNKEPFEPLENLTQVINTRGTFTPLGVSRSSSAVGEAVSKGLSNYYLMEELHDRVGESVAQFAQAEAATVTHCTAAGITLSVAALMTGNSAERIAALPNTKGMTQEVVIPAHQRVSYGHPIVQAIRLSGATPVVAGKAQGCSLEDIDQQLNNGKTCCLLMVSSKLVGQENLDFKAAIQIAHGKGIPVVIDGAAQDFRLQELVETGADLVLVSAQKYMAAPTAGLVVGKKNWVRAVRAQEKGIGRAMKPTKEALMGVWAALQERKSMDLEMWKARQQEKVKDFVSEANTLAGTRAWVVPDPTGLPFSRAHLAIIDRDSLPKAKAVAAQLKSGNPSIWTIDQNAEKGELAFELVQTNEKEIATILQRLKEIIS